MTVKVIPFLWCYGTAQPCHVLLSSPRFCWCILLSVPVITLKGVGLLLWFMIKPFLLLISSSFPCHLSAGPLTSFNKILFLNIYITLSFIVQWIYVVVTIKQNIQRNPVIHNGLRFPISSGQVCRSFHVVYQVCWNSSKIFLVVTIGACLVSIYNDLWESWWEPLISQGNDPKGLGTSIKADG